MHPLHILIGNIILGAAMSGCEVILGKDCGGDQNIQLLCSSEAEMATRFCSVDAIILKNGQVITIIEIEESDKRPVALCGKVLVSALAANFNHQGTRYPIAAHASFVQVIDTRKLKRNSSKLAQCWHLAELIRSNLQNHDRKMAYEIFHGNITEFERPEAQQELQDHLRAACSTAEVLS
jgi:hypothetical protein